VIRRVIGPAEIAALAVHLMTNTAVTGATFEIDGGQRVVEGCGLRGETHD
jgi:NAD(P)-dependent dehydrogenase (short-subunit alcohol dehydrogenase family)